jgi:hypothetical protein
VKPGPPRSRLGTLQRIRNTLVAAAASPRMGVLPEARLVRRASREPVPPVWVRRSRCAVGRSLGFAVFPARGGRAGLNARHAHPSSSATAGVCPSET